MVAQLQNTLAHDGLFNMSMDNCIASDIDGRQLYLGITVGADPEMPPRQAIYPVPYAGSLRPGANISSNGGGPASSTNYAVNLTVGQAAIGASSSTNYGVGLGHGYGIREHQIYLPLVVKDYG